MVSIQTRAHIGADGRLCLDVPTELCGRDVDVVLVLQPGPGQASGPDAGAAREAGWPDGFIEATSGMWQGVPLVREPQGEYEVRDELK